MTLSIASTHQLEMRHAYYEGAPGALVSGLVWLAAAAACYRLGIDKAAWTLLVGGALIHPLSTIVAKLIGRPAKTGKDNALNALAMASTIWLIVCCAMAYGLFLLKPALFFPAMMAVIGSRYLVFASVYGRAMFWGLGIALIVAANASLWVSVSPAVVAGVGGVIEIVFACLLFSKAAKTAA
ncbi:DUF7010 family protein [Lysobacter sp. cf310]|uniref:DUF7010 family protein n=1 Tax=Lysobacter sp. cf310 TaxID=1761790 RepID=UPI0008E553E5|nr:hypothetical protein [Lysobacter sp. cf310]SFK95238.1 hypothetical protein SAMN04487938_2602 [Lysobacter sp. cf310]